MITTYRVLARLIAILVAVQAAVVVWGIFGEGQFIMAGGVVDKAMMENRDGPLPFPEVLGFIIHGINGGMVIPVVAVALLVVSFFARVRGAVRLAAIVLALVLIQITLGYAGHGMPGLGLLHGLNAFAIVGASLAAVARVKSPTVAAETVTAGR